MRERRPLSDLLSLIIFLPLHIIADGSSSTVTINPPLGETGISVRLISKVRRRGMAWALRQGQTNSKTATSFEKLSPLKNLSSTKSPPFNSHLETDPSPYLLVHIHGGGFIALSSETHDVSPAPSILSLFNELVYYFPQKCI